MSYRGKRPNRSDDGAVPAKRRKRPTAEEEEAASLAASWQPRPFNDLKSIYNRTATEAPAELFRKDLISAMKLPDSEPLASDEYWVIVDQWKQEWERGVQVPVNPDSLPEPSVTVTQCANAIKYNQEFRMPKNKYIRITKDENFRPDEHILSNAPAKAEAACFYDLDECDIAWLKILNCERAAAGFSRVTEEQLERVIERLEICCWEKIQAILRNEEGLGIEYDENVICDVCRSPDSEDGNEMVFCDSCNICVHQACYGITSIPEGQWLCGTCSTDSRPDCVLCPTKGGAMKATRSGQKWAHVSCALWIPEVSIGCVEKMEPITKISSIPASRWALICVLCRERVGACIQCSVKTCKTAYHVTCAFKHGLEMRAIIEDENADDGVKLRSYCEKHSKTTKKDKCASATATSDDDESKRKKRKDMTSEEKNQARAARLHEIEAEFDKHVTVKDVVMQVDVDVEALQYIYNYWKLKRRSEFNKPLLPPKSEDVDMLSHKQEQADIEKMKMFVQLRQDLERVRNLCYMVSRREKLSRTFFRMREQTFHKQAAVLSTAGSSLVSTIEQAVIEANHGPSIYDRLYSYDGAEDHTKDFDLLLARISGRKSPYSSSDEKKRSEFNGVLKSKDNPYKKLYFNGSSKRRSVSLYGSSSGASSGDDRPKESKIELARTSSEDDKPSPMLSPKRKTRVNRKNKISIERRNKRLSATFSHSRDSSTENEENHKALTKKEWNRSRLHQMERELGISGTDSDEIELLRTISNKTIGESQKVKAICSIYSDSNSNSSGASSDVSMKDDQSSSTANEALQNKLRTKAAMKEFTQKEAKNSIKKKTLGRPKKKEQSPSSPENKIDYVPSNLIVPQRQAAKKATENLKATTNTSRTKEAVVIIEQGNKTPTSHSNTDLEKTKSKPKTIKPVVKDFKSVQKKDEKLSLSDSERETEKDDVLDALLAYVPQRQAAKKAAEHIKSGLGSKQQPPSEQQPQVDGEKAKKDVKEDLAKTKKDNDKMKKEILETTNETAAKSSKITTESKEKSSSSSSSSSSTSSSDSSSSSSSDSDETRKVPPPLGNFITSNAKEQSKRATAKDWPFLDKGTQSAASSSSSSSSESSRSSSPVDSVKIPESKSVTRPVPKSSRRPSDKRTATPVEREKQSNVQSGRKVNSRRSIANDSRDRSRDVHGRTRDISDNESLEREQQQQQQRSENRERKQKLERQEQQEKKDRSHEPRRDDLFTSLRKNDKKLKDERKGSEKIEPDLSNLEREILERKAGKEGATYNKSKSTLDRLLDKKLDKEALKSSVTTLKKVEKQKSNLLDKRSPEQHKSLEKPQSPHKSKSPDKFVKPDNEICNKAIKKDILEKLPVINKKSPSKNKSIDEIFSNKMNNEKSKSEQKKGKNSTTKNVKSLDEDCIKNKIVDDNQKENIHTRQTSNQIGENKKIMDESIQRIPDDRKNSKSSHSNTALQHKLSLSPQCLNRDSDLLNFDILDDDGFGISKDEEISRAPLSFSFGNVSLFKEDTKEDSARETLNLVEKLRMELSKKSTGCDVDDCVSIASSTRQENDRIESEQLLPSETHDSLGVSDSEQKEKCSLPHQPQVNLEMRVEVSQAHLESLEQRKDDNVSLQYSCAANVPLEADKIVPSLSHPQLDSVASSNLPSSQPERWIPPTDSYSSQINNFTDQANIPAEVGQRYLEHYSASDPQLTHHQSLSSQIDARVHEDLHKSQSPIVPDRKVSQTPFLEQSSLDCMPSPSPYGDLHPQAKWADSHVMPARRSSSSSVTSTSSSCSRRNDNMEEEILKRPEIIPVNRPPLDMHFGVLPNISFPPLDPSYPPPFSDTSQFVSPVSLFPPPPSINTQIPFPSPGVAMFPPTFGAPFSAPHSVIPSLSKPLEDSMRFPSACTATFTSSQRNMELIAAMVNAPPPTPKEPLVDEEEEIPPISEPSLPFTSTAEVSITPTPTTVDTSASPALSGGTPGSNHIEPSPNPSIKSNSSAGKRSPSKPTRFSARVTSQQQNKSPTKSPGKSPRQDNLKSGRGRGDKRNNTKTMRGANRGRGRGRGRGRSVQSQHNDFIIGSANTIHNKLVGTVYDLDFDDDISNENMADLRAMRERRKSADVHDRKSDMTGLSRDSSQSPKFASPLHSSQKNRSYVPDLRDLRPPSPIKDNSHKSNSPSNASEVTQTFSDIVQPVLPGPVDMRTYNSNFESSAFNETNLLNAFASGTAESHPHEDIDEDFEKEFQSALTASKKPEEPIIPETANIKVSLSDSRNQLKVKIKGPIANYTSVSNLPSSTVDPISVSNISSIPTINNVISNSAAVVNSGTSNLRRMRKKELLRQYWTQDMNMDDSTGASGIIATPVTPHINRTTITIPKAVASMTSIPTRDDYRDYRTGTDDPLDTKSRKENKTRQPLSRELRQLDLSLDDDTNNERRRSVGSIGSNVSLSTSLDSGLSNKRRGRPNVTPKTPQTTPKLKIKISRNSIVGTSRLDEKKDRIRPPKKRLSTLAQPSFEDLKRESMKFRKRVMAVFDGERKKKKDKHKKRKDKQEVQIIPKDGNNSTKLIIRFVRNPDSEDENKRTGDDVENSAASFERTGDITLGGDGEKELPNSVGGVSALRQVRPVKTPIKLKLSRCQEGSGYVMKTENLPDPEPPDKETDKAISLSPSHDPPQPPPPPPPTLNVIENVHTPTPLILNKDCEVR